VSRVRASAVLACVLLSCACGGPSQAVHTRASSAPPTNRALLPTEPTLATPTVSPTPTGPAARVDLVLSGSLAATIHQARAVGTCGPVPDGFSAELDLQSGGQPYRLSIAIVGYHGPGRYGIPPQRVSLKSLASGPQQAFTPAVQGNVTVDKGEAAGGIDAGLAGGGGVRGSWSC